MSTSIDRQRVVWVSLVVVLVAAGCDEGRASRPAPHREPVRGATGAYAVTEVVGGGSLSGRVTWRGPLPEPVVASGGMDPGVCGAESRLPVLVVGSRGGVAGSVVVLDGIREGRGVEIPSEPVLLRLVNCAFEPHVVAIGRGGRLRLENGDSILHAAQATDGRGSVRFDLGLPTLGAASELTLDEPGILRVRDDAGHPGMLAWVHVFEHPYFAVTDADGRFRIGAIPPGTYAVRAWHEAVRGTAEGSVGSAAMLLGRTVTILSGHDSTIDFELDAATAEAAGD